MPISQKSRGQDFVGSVLETCLQKAPRLDEDSAYFIVANALPFSVPQNTQSPLFDYSFYTRAAGSLT